MSSSSVLESPDVVPSDVERAALAARAEPDAAAAITTVSSSAASPSASGSASPVEASAATAGSSTAAPVSPPVPVIGVSPDARAATLADWALVIVPGVVWGASFLFIAEGLHAMAPYGVAFLRIVIGFATLSLIPAARGPVARADLGRIAALGVIWMAFPLTMFPLAEQYVSTALTGMLNGATPLFAAIVASLVARHLPARGILVGLAVGLTGAVLIALPGVRESESSLRGVLMILAALMSYGVAFTMLRDLQQRNGALPVIWRALGIAMLLTAPLGLPAVVDANWSLRAALSLLALGALGTGVAYSMIGKATGRIGPTRASAATFLTPVVALGLGVLVRHEQVAVLSMAGCAVCLVGAAIMTASRARQSRG